LGFVESLALLARVGLSALAAQRCCHLASTADHACEELARTSDAPARARGFTNACRHSIFDPNRLSGQQPTLADYSMVKTEVYPWVTLMKKPKGSIFTYIVSDPFFVSSSLFLCLQDIESASLASTYGSSASWSGYARATAPCR
jgi:hypothetical protein